MTRRASEQRWPAKWTPRQREDWLGRSGTRELAVAFAAAGWPAAEVRKATEHLAELGQVALPSGSAELHKRLGHRLDDLIATGGPSLREDSVLSCSVAEPARVEVWQLVPTGNEHVWTRHNLNGKRWSIEESAAGADVAAALAACPDLIRLSRQQIKYFTTDEGVLPAAKLLASMQVASDSGAPPADWDAAEPFIEEDEYVEEMAAGVEVVPVWARLGGTRITGLSTGFTGHSGPTAVLVDAFEQQFVPIEELASSTWFSESGGAPISWDGGNSLSRLNGRVGYARQWGDMGVEDEIVTLPADDDAEGLAEAIAAWCPEDAEIWAALDLEPFDPYERLTDRERAEWDELLAAPTAEFHLNVAHAVVDALRRKLARSSAYATTAAAMRRPTSPLGQAFKEALEEVAADGALAPILYGEWQTVDPELD